MGRLGSVQGSSSVASQWQQLRQEDRSNASSVDLFDDNDLSWLVGDPATGDKNGDNGGLQSLETLDDSAWLEEDML